MCMEDVRIGRKTQALEVHFTASTSFLQVLRASPNRRAVLFCSIAASNLTFSTNNDGSGGGLYITSGGVAVELDVENFGAVVQAAWFVKASAGTPVVTVFESLLGDQ